MGCEQWYVHGNLARAFRWGEENFKQKRWEHKMEVDPMKMCFLLKLVILHCYVSLPQGIWGSHHFPWPDLARFGLTSLFGQRGSVPKSISPSYAVPAIDRTSVETANVWNKKDLKVALNHETEMRKQVSHACRWLFLLEDGYSMHVAISAIYGVEMKCVTSNWNTWKMVKSCMFIEIWWNSVRVTPACFQA